MQSGAQSRKNITTGVFRGGCVARRCEASCETDAGVAPVVSGGYGEPGWKKKLPAVGLE